MNPIESMHRPLFTLISCLLFASCAPPRVTPEKLHAHYRAHAMETMNQMEYMGSKGKDHYFHHARLSMMKAVYRVSKDGLTIEDEFPLTNDRSRWRPYMIVEVDAAGAGFLLVPHKHVPLKLGEAPLIEGIRQIQP